MGRKPVRGGSPPKDSREIRIIRVVIGVLFHRFDKVNVVVLVYIFSIVNIIIVNIK